MRTYLLSLLLGSSALAAAAQGYQAPRHYHNARGQAYRRPPLQLSVSANTAAYNGDITSRLADNEFQLGLGVGVVRTLTPHVSLAFDLGYFRVAAKDFNPTRGFSFTNTGALASALVRLNLLPDRRLYLGRAYRPTAFLLFAEAGLAAFTCNPNVQQGVEALPPEPGVSFPLLAGALPVGGGLTLRPGSRFAVTLEGLYYVTSTDQLDGISQRGNPNSNDGFATGSVKLEFSLGPGRGRPLARYD